MYFANIDAWIQIVQTILLAWVVTQNIGAREEMKKLREELIALVQSSRH